MTNFQNRNFDLSGRQIRTGPNFPGSSLGGSMDLPGDYGPPRRPLDRLDRDLEYDAGFADRRFHRVPDGAYDNRNEKGPFMGLLTKFAERTSLQGIPFIYVVRKTYRKILWALIFVIMTIITIGHLSLLAYTFGQFEKTSSIKLQRDTLQFPSVTLCNINPVELSKLEEAANHTEGPLWDMLQIVDGVRNKKRRKKRQVQSGQSADGGLLGNVQGVNLINQDFLGFDSDNGFDSEEYGEGDISSSQLIYESFYHYLGQLDKDTRIDIGHDDNLLIDCQFNGRVCYPSNFSMSLSKNYGNCFTFNSADVRAKSYKSIKAGPTLGLQLVMYIQNRQYLTGLTVGKGIRVVVHPFGTMPLADGGFSAPPGFETNLGLKMVKLQRLGGRYGVCGDEGVYTERYNFTYSLEACLTTCDPRRIIDTCNCYKGEDIEYYAEDDIDDHRICNSDTDYNCIDDLSNDDDNPCNCNEACRETRYEADISMNTWPDINKWVDLYETVCDNIGWDSLDCDYLRNVTEDQQEVTLRQNFLKMNIYYEDLTFETIEESASYDNIQFVSDIGGTFGLWIGASIMTLCEVLDLLFNCCLVCCKDGQSRDRRRPRHMTDYNGGGYFDGPRPMYGRKPDHRAQGLGYADWGSPPPF